MLSYHITSIFITTCIILLSSSPESQYRWLTGQQQQQQHASEAYTCCDPLNVNASPVHRTGICTNNAAPTDNFIVLGVLTMRRISKLLIHFSGAFTRAMRAIACNIMYVHYIK